MKMKVPYEAQNVNAMLVLLSVMIGMFMVSVANQSVFGGVASVLGLDAVVRYLIKFVKKC